MTSASGGRTDAPSSAGVGWLAAAVGALVGDGAAVGAIVADGGAVGAGASVGAGALVAIGGAAVAPDAVGWEVAGTAWPQAANASIEIANTILRMQYSLLQ